MYICSAESYQIGVYSLEQATLQIHTSLLHQAWILNLHCSLLLLFSCCYWRYVWVQHLLPQIFDAIAHSKTLNWTTPKREKLFIRLLKVIQGLALHMQIFLDHRLTNKKGLTSCLTDFTGNFHKFNRYSLTFIEIHSNMFDET